MLSAVLTEKRRQRVSDAELARRWGVSREWLAGRFSGKKGLTGSEVAHIARALRVPVSQLAGE